MGNSPSLGLGGTELHDRRDQEGMEIRDERPNDNKELAGAKTKSKDDESSISKPLQVDKTSLHNLREMSVKMLLWELSLSNKQLLNVFLA